MLDNGRTNLSIEHDSHQHCLAGVGLLTYIYIYMYLGGLAQSDRLLLVRRS